MQNAQTKDGKGNVEESELVFEVKLDVNSKEYQRLKHIQKLTFIEDIPQILLGCVNIAYNYYFRYIRGGSQTGQDAPHKEPSEK